MESILANFDIDVKPILWKIFPSWKSPKIFKEMYDKDKSKGKAKSSILMWALVHVYDKSKDNPYRMLDSIERKEVIAEDILEDPTFKWEDYEKEMEAMSKIFYGEEERSLYALEDYIGKRRRHIEKEQDEMCLATMKDLDEAIKRNKPIFDEMERLRNVVSLKEEAGRTKGDIVESAMEKGDI